MALQPLQLTKFSATVCLTAMLYACGASTPVVETITETTPVDPVTSSVTIATEPVALDPEVEYQFKLGIKAMAEKDYDKAEAVFLKMTQTQPNLSGPFANLGTVLSSKKDYVNAETAFKQALRLNAENAEAYNQLGLLYRQTGRFSEALQTYKQGLMISPRNTNLLRNTGIVLELYLSSPEAALEYYQRYLEEKPEDKQVQLWKAYLSQQAGS